MTHLLEPSAQRRRPWAVWLILGLVVTVASTGAITECVGDPPPFETQPLAASTTIPMPTSEPEARESAEALLAECSLASGYTYGPSRVEPAPLHRLAQRASGRPSHGLPAAGGR